MVTVTAHIRVTREPSASEKLKIRAALGKFSWVSCVRFETSFDEPEIHVEHSRSDMDRDTHKAMQDLVAVLQRVVPGLAVND